MTTNMNMKHAAKQLCTHLNNIFSVLAPGQQPLLQNGLNIDLRYRATYGNPFLRTSNASLPPLPPPSTANPAATPAPPPYNANRNTQNVSGGGSVVGISAANTLQTQLSSPSGQFILPANGNLKKGALATHV